MKTLIFALLTPTAAIASSVHEICSNADSSIRLARGQFENFVEVTKVDNGQPHKVLLDNVEATAHASQIVLDEKRCDYELGLRIWRRLYFRQFVILSNAGETFKGISGAVPPDYQMIKADMLCEFGGNYMDGDCLK